jgi:NAD(P)-dependent dehydrogenase (short-subunit alcohol dehydrogenase family)
LRLKERVCLITGASSGIGTATAHAFACEGAALALTGRDVDRGRLAVVACSTEVATDAFFAPGDVTDQHLSMTLPTSSTVSRPQGDQKER